MAGNRANPSTQRQVVWPWFIVGCVLMGAALVAFFWAFAQRDITSSQRFLLLWLLPLASGFSAGSFVGSMKVTGPIGNLTAAATGGFAVWLLSYFLLPKPLDPAAADLPITNSAQELEKLLGDRYTLMREILAKEGETATDPPAFSALRAKIEEYLKALEAALASKQMVRVHEITKNLLALIDEEATKQVLPPAIWQSIRQECYAIPSYIDKKFNPTDPRWNTLDRSV